MAWHMVTIEEGIYAFKMLRDKPIGNIPLGKASSRWVDHTGIDIKGIGVNTRNRID